MSPGLCRNGHSRIPENRTNADKCKVCARIIQSRAREAVRQAKRLADARAQTQRNKELNGGEVIRDDGIQEHLRSARILELIDQKDRATTSWQRTAIQTAIHKLTKQKTEEDTNG